MITNIFKTQLSTLIAFAIAIAPLTGQTGGQKGKLTDFDKCPNA